MRLDKQFAPIRANSLLGVRIIQLLILSMENFERIMRSTGAGRVVMLILLAISGVGSPAVDPAPEQKESSCKHIYRPTCFQAVFAPVGQLRRANGVSRILFIGVL